MNDHDLIRDHLARVALAAWCNVPLEQLPATKEFSQHPNHSTMQAWARVVDAIRALPAAAPRPMGEAERDGWDVLLTDARAAAERAMVKFPQPNYVISKVAEEAGEVVKAAIHCAEGRETAENLRGEMVQTIAMLYRLWAEGDGVHGLPAVRAALPHPETPE